MAHSKTPQLKPPSTIPKTASGAEKDTKPTIMTPAAVAAIARAEAREVVGKQVGGFVDFLRDQSVIGIGIGIVLGTQMKTVVDQIMFSFVDPVTQLILPGKETLSQMTFTIHAPGRNTVIGWGAIAYSLFTFMMVAIIIYLIYKIFKLDKLTKKK